MRPEAQFLVQKFFKNQDFKNTVFSKFKSLLKIQNTISNLFLECPRYGKMETFINLGNFYQLVNK